MNDMLKKYFKTMIDSNRMSHAFLICNVKYNNLKDELNEILSDYFFNGKKIESLLNDVIIINPSNQKILKEDIINLKDELKLKSQFNQNRVYIICEAEKMNDFAANSLLKFLEEPEENIYAFLLTENINKVLSTIKSRCQIINIGSKNVFNLNNYDEDLINKSINVLKLIEEKKENAIPYIYDFFNKKEDKNVISNFLEIAKYFYKDSLNYKLSQNTNYFVNNDDFIIQVSSINSEKTLINKIMIIFSLESMLEYNMNINLLIDKLVLELGMIKNE